MMLLNFMLAALSLAGVIAAPVRTDAVPSPPALEVSTTAVPTTVTKPARSVPTSVWQHGRRAVDYDNVRPLSHPAGLAAPLPSFPTGDKAIHIRAVTNSVGGVTTVPLPLPTTTTPAVHVHRADVTPGAPTVPDGCLDDEVDADTTAAVLPRMLALRIKGVPPNPHATTTLNSIRARQLLLPTILFNAAAAAKVTPA
ncbi:hypothetical protein LXA43DRAFT_427569 [Ganoderma leucocontextum]|nr:hypothetical protein LXA43DRAFT_427569 [Ganoderma leucocontextum]